MPDVNKKILEKIENSLYPQEVKELVKALMYIELRNFERGDLRYSQDYDRVINRLVHSARHQEKSR